jgi:hypothetical protein
MYTVKALSEDHKNWIIGYVWEGSNCAYIIPHNLGVNFDKNRLNAVAYPVDKTTICKKVGIDAYWYDKQGGHIFPIYENDIVRFIINRTTYEGRVIKQFGNYVIALTNMEDSFFDLTDLKDCKSELLKVQIIGNCYDALQSENKPVEATERDSGISDECPYFEAREIGYDVQSGHSDYEHYCTKNYEKKILKSVHCTLCKQKGANK